MFRELEEGGKVDDGGGEDKGIEDVGSELKRLQQKNAKDKSQRRRWRSIATA